MASYRAAWVLPIAGPPIRDGWVAVDGGRIVAYGSATRHVRVDGARRSSRRRRRDPARPRQRAHPSRADVACGARCRRPRRCDAWIAGADRAARAATGDPLAGDIIERHTRGHRRSSSAPGPVLIGDISNTLVAAARRCATPACRRTSFTSCSASIVPDPAPHRRGGRAGGGSRPCGRSDAWLCA